MKRDMNLVRDLLLKLEPLEAHFDKPIGLIVGEGPLAFKKRSKDEIAYHIRIMTQGDLIAMGGIMEDGVTIQKYFGFRWLGHEFLDDVRDPKAWKKTKDAAKKLGGGSLAFLWDIAKATATTEFQRHLGLLP